MSESTIKYLDKYIVINTFCRLHFAFYVQQATIYDRQTNQVIGNLSITLM